MRNEKGKKKVGNSHPDGVVLCALLSVICSLYKFRMAFLLFLSASLESAHARQSSNKFDLCSRLIADFSFFIFHFPSFANLFATASGNISVGMVPALKASRTCVEL